MDFSNISNAVGENNVLIGFLFVVGFLVWKYVIQPIANENDPVPETPGTVREE